MLVYPSTVWAVYYRNVDGILRRHVYFTKHHAEQFARAMRHPSAGATEIQVYGENPYHADHSERA